MMNTALNLPNRITLARLGLAIIFFVLIAQYTHGTSSTRILDAAVVLFIIAASTDILDGYIARRRGLETQLGRMLDPFVDKVLVCGAFILFTGPGFVVQDSVGPAFQPVRYNVTGVQAWMVVVIVGRELLVTGLRGFSESRGHSFAASYHGKMKMWVQSITAPVVLFIVAHQDTWLGGAWVQQTKTGLVWLTVAVTALSAIHYIIQSRHILEEKV